MVTMVTRVTDMVLEIRVVCDYMYMSLLMSDSIGSTVTFVKHMLNTFVNIYIYAVIGNRYTWLFNVNLCTNEHSLLSRFL